MRLKTILDELFDAKPRMNERTLAKLQELPFDEAVDFPVIWAFLRYAQIEAAGTCLERVPDEFKNYTYHALNDFYQALKECRDAEGVFPLNISWREWWNGPHLDFPKELEGQELSSWNPVRVNGIEDGLAYLVIGQREKDGTVYGLVEMPFAELQSACNEDLDSSQGFYNDHQFLEFGFYGDKLLVRKHDMKPYINEFLSPLFNIIKPWVDERSRRIKEFADSFYKD